MTGTRTQAKALSTSLPASQQRLLCDYVRTRPHARPYDPYFVERVAHHRSREWVFGHTPPFAWTLPCGRLEVEHGRIVRVTGAGAHEAWIGQPFDPERPWREAPSGEQG